MMMMMVMTMGGIWFRDALVFQRVHLHHTPLMSDAEKLDASEIKSIDLHDDEHDNYDDDDN